MSQLLIHSLATPVLVSAATVVGDGPATAVSGITDEDDVSTSFYIITTVI